MSLTSLHRPDEEETRRQITATMLAMSVFAPRAGC
jgi:hypothetical protein